MSIVLRRSPSIVTRSLLLSSSTLAFPTQTPSFSSFSSFSSSFSSFTFTSSPSLFRSFATKSKSPSTPKMSSDAKSSKESLHAVGVTIPTTGITVHGANPKDVIDLEKLFSGRKVVIFGVPGSFTPGCSATHLPGYINDSEKIKKKGIDEIVCLSVNDSFVHSAWGKAHNVEGKVTMLADTNAEFVKALGLDFHAPPLGGTRSVRFSAVVEDKKITQINVEPDNTGLTCSLSNGLKL